MKTPIRPTALLQLFFALAPFFVSATNYSNNGSGQSYNLYNGDTLRVTGGIYHGNLNTFNTGAVVVVAAGATFKPDYIISPSGKIINYGTCVFNAFGTNGGFGFENYNVATISGDLNLYDGSRQTWTNNLGATMAISGSFYMNNTLFTNYAAMSVSGNFALYTSTANLVNRGTITIDGSFSMSNGVLTNQNRIKTNDFNAWGGQVINEGSISPRGNMVFNSGTNYTNSCLLITNSGFTNYGNFQNNGLLWVGRTGTASDYFYNSGNFTNAADAQVKAVRLTNYNTLSGGGSYYINGDSYSSGTVGRTGATTDTIKIYDVTRTNPATFFDIQYGTVNPNVVFRSMPLPDTTQVNYSGCSTYFKTDLGSILPVEWNYFDVKSVHGQPVLNWSAQYEAAMQFEVERSYDKSNFGTIKTMIAAPSQSYSYQDASADEKQPVIYYRIKGRSAINGAQKYTATKMIRQNTIGANGLAIYPNPVLNAATINFTTEKAEQVTLRVRNLNGQQVVVKTVSVSAGSNSLALAEVTGLQSGCYIIEAAAATAAIATAQFTKL